MTKLIDMNLAGLAYNVGSVTVNVGTDPGTVTSGIAHGLGVTPAAVLVGPGGLISGGFPRLSLEGSPGSSTFGVRAQYLAGTIPMYWVALAAATTAGLRLEDQDQAQGGVYIHTHLANDVHTGFDVMNHVVAHGLGATPRAAFVMLDTIFIPSSSTYVMGSGGIQSMDATNITFGYSLSLSISAGTYTPQNATVIAFR